MKRTKINFRAINQNIYDNIEKVAEVFGFELIPSNEDQFVSCCPVHGGDNPTAFRIYPNGGWVCFTRGCHDGQNSFIHLLKLLIEKRLSIEANIPFVIEWYLDNVLGGVDVLDLPKTIKATAKYKYIPKIFYENVTEWKKFATGCPSKHYIEAGFPKEIVERYCIGECLDPKERFFKRVMIPQLNRRGQVVGYSGRSIYPQCTICKLYHSPKAPCPTENLNNFGKWRHGWGFKTGYNMYNDWNIPTNIEDIIVVESIGNVLRGVEAGISNILGLFGNKLSNGQAQILEELGVKRITWIADRDINNAGIDGATKAIKNNPQFKFYVLLPPAGVKDIAQMSAQRLRRFLGLKGVYIG